MKSTFLGLRMVLPLSILLCLNSLVSCDQEKKTALPVNSAKESWMLSGFKKADSINPILNPSATHSFLEPIHNKISYWEAKNVLNPSAVVRNNKVYLLYRAQDSAMTSRLGLAISADGLHFERQPAPVFYPDNDVMNGYEWPGGVEDPRVIESEDGTYMMTYTAYDGKTARLCLASSKDLISWIKHGPVLKNEKYQNMWSKSGAIICEQRKEKTIAVKINGKYWMYFGDTSLFAATSDDLINWDVVLNEENKKIIAVLHPRPGYFDSRLVEPGPFALLRDEGILLIYNASNAANYNDANLPKFAYAAGQALFDKENPVKLLKRSKTFFIHPDKPYEKTGEVNEVCFVEGLVYFKDKWFLYYGTADSKIAVSVKSNE